MLTIIQSGSQAWAVAAAGDDLHVYSREEAGEWLEVLLSEGSEHLDQDGSSILEALYEQYATADQNGHAAAPEVDQQEPEDEEDEPEGEAEQPEDEEEQAEDAEEEPEDEEEQAEDEEEEPEEREEKPRRSRARTRATKK